MSALANKIQLPDFDAQFRGVSTFRQTARGHAITLRDIHKSFGATDVLKGVSLFVPAGQFLAIIGRSGCGKSTLLRLLAGLDRPDHGDILVGPATDQAEIANTARLMFQEPRLLPWQRVLANVEVGLGAERYTAGARDRALDTLNAVGLGLRADEWPTVLSGGQRQRVALARALVSRPQFLALDEPLGALDALTRIEMQALLERVWLAQGFTAVLVTHDVAEAVALADRVVMLDEGRVALDLPVTIPRPRRRGSVDLAILEERILKELIRDENPEPDYVV